LTQAGAATFPLRLRAAEFELDSGTDLGRLESPLRLVANVSRHERSGWQIGDATLELPRLRFGTSATTEAPHRAVFRLKHGGEPRAVTQREADLQVQGSRLGALFPLLGIPRSVELMLAPFREQPFSASATLDNADDAVWLRDIRIQTHTLELRGFVCADHGKKRGALLIATPAVRLGLSLRGERPDITLHPPSNWLERQRVAD
jgi:hypothetical protein